MTISWMTWQEYAWKNELAVQTERAIAHGREVADEEFSGSHSPLDMLERAIVLAGFCIRRLLEKKLVTDALAEMKLAVRSFPTRSDGAFRPPFRGSSGGAAFRNYDFMAPMILKMTAGELANEIIHSSQLMVLDGEDFAADGFLIASDWHLKSRVLHMSFDEFSAFAGSLLDDRVLASTDSWDPETGKVTYERLGRPGSRKSPFGYEKP